MIFMLLLGVAVTKGRRTEESKHVALGLRTGGPRRPGPKFLTDKPAKEGDVWRQERDANISPVLL